MPEGAQCDVVRRPRADAGQGGPARDELVERAFDAEVDVAVEQRACDRADRLRPRAGNSDAGQVRVGQRGRRRAQVGQPVRGRSEEHTSELQSLMRISYAVFCLTKKKSNAE